MDTYINSETAVDPSTMLGQEMICGAEHGLHRHADRNRSAVDQVKEWVAFLEYMEQYPNMLDTDLLLI